MTSTSTDLIDNRWRLTRKLGSGKFCSVYQAEDADGNVVAVKLESVHASVPTLPREILYLDWLHKSSIPAVGIPRLYHAGTHNGSTVMVIEKLGPSLQEIANRSGGKIPLKSVLLAAVRILEIIEFVHHRSVLHCDINPNNILTGLQDPNRLYLIDYGLARQFRDHYSGVHFSHKESGLSNGTFEFASVNAMREQALSRRDDLESIGYCLIYINRGRLPWTGMREKNLSSLQRSVAGRKRALRTHEICSGMPREFRQYFRYVRTLSFFDRPDYSFLKQLFQDCLARKGFVSENMWGSQG